jgi:hypothetical protein
MRFTFTLLAVLLGVFAGCKKSGGGGDAVAKMSALRDKMCACKDKPCADAVKADLLTWVSAQKGGDSVSDADQKKLAAAADELNRCVDKIDVEAAAAMAGSATTGAETGSAAGGTGGSGADTGSAAMGSGAGSDAAGAAGDTMAHRAGMCPSTVLGGTTKAALKGKAVVVTIEATDKDAIAAIQKRANELLAEKADALTGVGHDRKGTHGGAQGLCPVYVPEGAKATAKRIARGVVVTITPKDKPDALEKEIEGRIAKAGDWVKANVKEGDKGNQGGVGGGKGDDGSNHSGKGDGKGHERKKGGGGGNGTGGGGGKGTGDGSGGGGW